MRARSFLNRHPAATVAVVIVLTGIAVASILLQLRPTSELAFVPRKAFYSVDDGDTWFVDEVDKITPFDHGGRPAVLLHLFTCDGGKTRFVGYLERLPDGAPETYRARMHLPAQVVPEADDVGAVVGTLVKRKGDADWVSSQDNDRFRQVIHVQCPGGGGDPTPVSAD